MSEFGSRLASRLPQSWPGRAVWLMLAIAALWIAYRVGFRYSQCRAIRSEKGACSFSALNDAYLDVWLLVINTISKVLYYLLP